MTDKPYTPTMFDMRGAYFGYRSAFGFFDPAIYAEFDRWLEQVRAEAKVEALEEAAEAARGYELSAPDDWLHERADHVRSNHE